jgi:hypothetical protein
VLLGNGSAGFAAAERALSSAVLGPLRQTVEPT